MCLLKVESESSIRLFRHQVFKLTSIKGRGKYNLWNTCFLTQCTRWQRRWSLSASSSWRPGELWKDMAIKCFAWTGVKTRGELWARPRYKNKSSSIALPHTVWINGFYTLCSALLGPTGSHLGFLLHRKCCYQQNNCCGLTAIWELSMILQSFLQIKRPITFYYVFRISIPCVLFLSCRMERWLCGMRLQPTRYMNYTECLNSSIIIHISFTSGRDWFKNMYQSY